MRKYVAVAAAATAMVGLANAASAASYTDFAQFQAAAGTLGTDNFDAAPWVPNTAAAQGTTSLGFGWSAANALYTSGALARSGSGSLTSLDGAPGADPFDMLEAVAPGGITAIGGYVTTYGQAHNVTISAFDSNDVLLETLVVGPSVGNGYVFFGLTSDTAIARIRLASTNVTNPIGDDFQLDDFVFGAAAPTNPPPTSDVPAPASLLMLGTALAGLGLARRRRA